MSGGRLACGRQIDDVVAQVAAGQGGDRDTHQQNCPYCHAALAEYERLWAPLAELAAEKPGAPDSIVVNALRRIRGAVEHNDYGVLESPLGRTRISARVVVAVARESAQAVPGVRVALSKHVTSRTAGRSDVHGPDTAVNPAGGAEVVAGVAGRSTAIEITLAADYGADLHRLAEHVRAAVAAQIRALTDLEPVQITIIIDDVFE